MNRRLSTIAAAALLTSSTLFAQTGVTLPEYSEVQLPNGATLLLMEKPDVPLVSFTALIRGGQSGDTAAALGIGRLDGVILSGWRAGARVQVIFQKVASCAGKPAGPCFEGTIQIEHAPKQ